MARRGYSKTVAVLFSKTARLLYRCRPPEPPWCFAARTGFLLMCRPAQRAMPTDFFRVGPFIFRVGLFIDGLETCLRGKLLPLVGQIDFWVVDPTNAIYLPSDAALL